MRVGESAERPREEHTSAPVLHNRTTGSRSRSPAPGAGSINDFISLNGNFLVITILK